MNATIKKAIDDEIAKLVRLQPAPVPPFGYGSDLDCFDDITDDAAELDPNSTLGLAQAAYHYVSSPRGSIVDAPDVGIDLRSYLNVPLTAARVTELAGDVSSEIKKDDRFAEVTVTVQQPTLASLRVSITIEPADPELDTFALILAVTDAGVLVEAFE